MTRAALIILILINRFCAFSQIPHEVLHVVGCFGNGKTETHFEFDAEEILNVDFDRDEVVYSVPRFLYDDPSKVFKNFDIFRTAENNKKTCITVVNIYNVLEKNPPEEMDPPDSILYPSEEVQLGVENLLICFVNHFYPPEIKVSWTRNGRLVSEGVSLSRYYPNNDQTFHQFTTLSFTPKEGDVYSCTVEHLALGWPKTKIWEPDFSPSSPGPDVYCGVGLALGLLGVAAGTFLMVKGHHRSVI